MASNDHFPPHPDASAIAGDLLRQAFIHQLGLTSPTIPENEVAADQEGVRWRFVPLLNGTLPGTIHLHLCSGKDGEPTALSWDPRGRGDVGPTTRAAARAEVERLWPINVNLPLDDAHFSLSRVIIQENQPGDLLPGYRGRFRHVDRQGGLMWYDLVGGTWPWENGNQVNSNPMWWLDLEAARRDLSRNYDDEPETKRRQGQLSYFTLRPESGPFSFSLSLPCLALLCRHLPYWLEPFHDWVPPADNDTLDLLPDFFLSFASPRLPYRNPCAIVPSGFPACTVFQYQLHHFTPTPKTWEAATFLESSGGLLMSFAPASRQGLLLERHVAKFTAGEEDVYLVERVSSVILFTYGEGEQWGITVLSDDDGVSDCREAVLDVKNNWSTGGPVTFRDTEFREGEVYFRKVILQLFEASERAWHNTLDRIDQLVGVTLSDFYSDKRKDDLMFDRSFLRSRDYFTALQLLRLVDKWADENVASLRERATAWRKELEEARSNGRLGREGAWPNCFNDPLATIEERTRALHERVRVMREDVISLRDGLFNATSLREATRGTSLNMTIYLFTIVTIIYTPIGFLATFWALPWLNNPSNPDEHVPRPREFVSSFVIVPALTYLFVILFALYFWPTQPRGVLVALLYRKIKGSLVGFGSAAAAHLKQAPKTNDGGAAPGQPGAEAGGRTTMPDEEKVVPR